MPARSMFPMVLTQAVEEMSRVGTRTREQIVDDYREAVEMELAKHPGVRETEVWGCEPAYEYVGCEGPVTVYTVRVGGRFDREVVDAGMAEELAGLSDGITVTADTRRPPEPADGATAGTPEDRVATRRASGD